MKKGDTIGIITPSTPAPVQFNERYQRGLTQLRKMGFNVLEGKCSKTSQGYRSASIKERAEEVNEFIRDDRVKAIISTIGGTNSNSLLPCIDYQAFEMQPKIIMGYSDVTALLLGIYAKTGITTFYGPAIVPSFGEFPEMFPKGREYFEKAVMNPEPIPYTLDIPTEWTEEMLDWRTQTREKKMLPNAGWKSLRGGRASGKLIGGNLNTMPGIIASHYFPPLKGAILFIEDSFKDMATQERSLSMLKLAGVFDEIEGLIVGKHEHFDDCKAPFTFEDLLIEVLGDREIPIMTNVDIGHTFPSQVFPVGIEAEMDTEAGRITFLESGVK
ncbi:S66 peptidase family protein [Bacillus sp. P14.5]|uniref:S66 family peptidase n=1 Tax=Bacillus sp. P14.5 TaxID=1983400 RepID=UPI000DEA4916|nr:S66 peptidase family protein [Bacillus sp. P14.5]